MAKTAKKIGSHWIKQIEKADKEERDWRKRARKTIERYRDERDRGRTHAVKFNILWANTETMRPALYSQTPRPEIRRRYQDKDPTGREIARVLERAVSFAAESYDFDKFGKRVTGDYLLPGRSVARIRYKPVFEKREEQIPLVQVEEDGKIVYKDVDNQSFDGRTEQIDGQFSGFRSEDTLVSEEVEAERVPWALFRMQPSDCWSNVDWIAFGAWYKRDEFRREFPKADLTQIDFTTPQKDPEKGMVGTHNERRYDEEAVLVWEVWDKLARKQIFVVDGHEDPLETNDDPLELTGFYPMPEPIYAVETNDDMVPIPEFCMYQDQAEELDSLTARIAKLTDAIRARGAYPGSSNADLEKIMEQDENTLVGIEDWNRFAGKGGTNMIQWVPIDQFAKVLQTLKAERLSLVGQIFELTGVSDIMRGNTDPRETKGAQVLKTQLGNRRLSDKQRDIQRFFRDIYRIKAEIIANHFSKQTLSMMTGTQIPDELMDVIRNDMLRTYKVDIETDSTIAIDILARREEMTAALEATGAFAQAFGPLIQAGVFQMEAVKEMLLSYLRSFRFGRRLEEAVDNMPEFEQKPDPAQEAQAEKAKMDAQIAQQKAQMDAQARQQELQIKQAEAQIKAAEAEAKMRMAEQEHQQEMRQDQQKHEQEMRQLAEEQRVKLALMAQQGQNDTAEKTAAKKVQFTFKDGEIDGAVIGGLDG